MSVSETTQVRDSFSPAMATLAWQKLAERVDALEHAWQAGPRPPQLSQFLADQPPALRQMALGELIKVDLEYRWLHYAQPKLLEEYVSEFPELAPGGEIPCDLIHEEYHVRRQAADPPEQEDYLRRFPRQAIALRRLFLSRPTAQATATLSVGSRRPPLNIGERIDDFDVLVPLGQGAFASVFLARQRSLQRLVALKVSRNQGTESQTLAQLDHPHIVRVFDQRLLPAQQLKLMYMEHVPGGTLQGVLDAARAINSPSRSGQTVLDAVDASLERQGVTPPHDSSLRRRLAAATWPQAICWLGARLAAALDYAHRKGVLHRDVKPANVLLAADGSPKLADFNVSFSSKLDGATPAAYFGGSLAYMSPEQLEASNPDDSRQPSELDGRSDIYSLAVMLWELLTGVRPFGEERVGNGMAATLKLLAERRRAGVPDTALMLLPPDLPDGLDDVLLACLAPGPNDRPASAGALARQLDICLQPQAQRLFRPRAGTWRQFMQRHALMAIILGGIIPHAIPSLFNTFFNFHHFLKGFPEEVQSNFWHFQVPIVNGVAYSLGTLLGVSFVWPVLMAAWGLRQNRVPDAQRLSKLRRRSLWTGDYVAWIGIGLWFISGIAFPVWLYVVAGVPPERTHIYSHFFLSQMVCGLIAMSQTFCVLTCISLRVLHPLLLSQDESDADEIKDLMRLDRRSVWYLGLAVVAPFVGFLVMTLTEEAGQVDAILMFLIGIACLFVSYRFWRTIQGDVAALIAALDPERRIADDTIGGLGSSLAGLR